MLRDHNVQNGTTLKGGKIHTNLEDREIRRPRRETDRRTEPQDQKRRKERGSSERNGYSEWDDEGEKIHTNLGMTMTMMRKKITRRVIAIRQSEAKSRERR